MKKGLMVIFVIGLIVIPLAIFGCKGKVQTEGETTNPESTEATVLTEEVVVTQAPMTDPVPAQESYVSQETIPPTAAVPSIQEKAKNVSAPNLEHNKEIQAALKAANFYTGNIDGKMGPKTKRAIIEFQKAKGLKADGKVGPKTWAELEKYLKQ